MPQSIGDLSCKNTDICNKLRNKTLDWMNWDTVSWTGSASWITKPNCPHLIWKYIQSEQHFLTAGLRKVCFFFFVFLCDLVFIYHFTCFYVAGYRKNHPSGLLMMEEYESNCRGVNDSTANYFSTVKAKLPYLGKLTGHIEHSKLHIQIIIGLWMSYVHVYDDAITVYIWQHWYLIDYIVYIGWMPLIIVSVK